METTEKDLMNDIKEKILKKNIKGVNKHLWNEVDSLDVELMDIMYSIEKFIEKYNKLNDKIDFTHENDAIVDRIVTYDFHVETFYKLLYDLEYVK